MQNGNEVMYECGLHDDGTCILQGKIDSRLGSRVGFNYVKNVLSCSVNYVMFSCFFHVLFTKDWFFHFLLFFSVYIS